MIDSNSKLLLIELNFKETKTEMYGFTAATWWENDDMIFIISFDRGYYDSSISFKNTKNIGGNLVRTLRRILNDDNYLVDELEASKKFNTFPTFRYVQILYENYDLIIKYTEEFDDLKVDSTNIDYLDFKQNVIATNKFWGDVNIRYNVKDSLYRVISQKRGSNLHQSIFKLGQNIGHSLLQSQLKIEVTESGSKIKHKFDDNFIVIESSFGIIKALRGFLNSAECYQTEKIRNRINGKYKDEVEKLIDDYGNIYPPILGYKTIGNIIVFFIVRKYLSIKLYKIENNYD